MKLKSSGDEVSFEKAYRKEVLDTLDPQDIFIKLGNSAVLLCWEKSGDFCHRRIVADWFLEKLKIVVPEIDSLF